jgi:hypothetical protein
MKSRKTLEIVIEFAAEELVWRVTVKNNIAVQESEDGKGI